MRIIFFAGKGGVGKTSAAAATGIKTAEMGRKTVIISLDVAHSLSDIFDLSKDLLDQNKGRPIEVGKNLWIQELDIIEEIEGNWGEIYRYISTLLQKTGMEEVLAEELSILPGMEEISLLLYINQYVQSKTFDVIILDCAPTGESLRFISIPSTLEWYFKKIFKIQRTAAKFVGPVAKKILDVPLPDDHYFAAIEHLFHRLQGVDQVLTDPEITSVRLVTNPEKIVLKETQRAFMYFCLHKMSIDAIIMNRILPRDVKDEYFNDWKKIQKQHIQIAEEFFSPIPIFMVNLFKEEIVGYPRLKDLSNQIYNGKNPMDRFFNEEPYKLTKENGEYQMMIKLPFIHKEDVELNKVSDELIIRVGGGRRNLLLPRQVAAAKSVQAKYESPYLKIFFKGDDHG
jgi:arsenite-transporting ATPase